MNYTLIEYIPVHHRAEVVLDAAGSPWPHNGAVRVYVEGRVSEYGLHPKWARAIQHSIPPYAIPENARSVLDVPPAALPPTFVVLSPRPDGATVYVSDLDTFPMVTTTDAAKARLWSSESDARHDAAIAGLDTTSRNGWQIAEAP